MRPRARLGVLLALGAPLVAARPRVLLAALCAPLVAAAGSDALVITSPVDGVAYAPGTPIFVSARLDADPSVAAALAEGAELCTSVDRAPDACVALADGASLPPLDSDALGPGSHVLRARAAARRDNVALWPGACSIRRAWTTPAYADAAKTIKDGRRLSELSAAGAGTSAPKARANSQP